jgi:hypothetical protein
MTPDRAAQRSAVERALLDFHRTPGKYALIRRQPSLLFASVKDVMQIASGRAPDNDDGVAPAAEVQKAACFFIRSALLYPDADHYALLGLEAEAEASIIKDRYRQMMRLMHPDFADALSEANWPADAATRVNQAYDVLSSPVRRRAYDDQRNPPPAPAAAPPRPEMRAATFRAASARPPAIDPRYRLKQLAVVFGVTGSMALAATLYISSTNEKESLVQRSREIDAMVAAALPADEPSNEAAPPNPAPAKREEAEKVVVADAVIVPPPIQLPAAVVAAAPAPAPVIARPPAAPVVAAVVPAPTPAPPPITKRPELPAVVAAAPARAPAPPAVIATITPLPAPAVAAAPIPVPVAVIIAAAPTPAPTAAPAVIAPRPAPPPIVAAPVPAAVPAPAPATAPAPSPVFAPIPAPAPAPIVVAMAKPAVFSPAPGPAAAPVRAVPGVTLAEVHPLLSKLLQQMESGWGDQVLSVLEREARGTPAAQSLARNYNALLEGGHRVRLANVQFKAEPREGRLLVTGRVSMLVGEQLPGATPKQLSVQAEFMSRDGSVVMTHLAQVEN